MEFCLSKGEQQNAVPSILMLTVIEVFVVLKALTAEHPEPEILPEFDEWEITAENLEEESPIGQEKQYLNSLLSRNWAFWGVGVANSSRVL